MHVPTALAVLVAALGAAPAQAQVYARVTVPDLERMGEFPEISPWDAADPAVVRAARPRVVIDGPGEAFLQFPLGDAEPDWHTPDVRLATVWVRLDAPAAVSGRLYAPESGASSLVRVPFTIAADAFDARLRDAWLAAEAEHWRSLAGPDVPGSAWFRHRAESAERALGREIESPTEGSERAREDELQETFGLFSGQRAVAENLRLDRELLVPEGGAEEVEFDDIQGVSTRAYDWSKEIEGLAPALDPLARWIPADQHALFLPSFDALLEMVDELEAHGGELWTIAEPRAESSGLRAFYERQLCLPLDERARALGGFAIRSVAVTGSDPYLRSGSDVCVLFESEQPTLLAAFLRSEMQRALQTTPAAAAEDFDVSGLPVHGVSSPDRGLSAYLTQLDGRTLAVTNSRVQLRHLAELGGATTAPLSLSPEYVFFRARTVRGAGDERALFVLTDATIRRWAGPRLRIAASRRTRAAAWLADAQCAALAGEEVPRTLPDGSELVVEDGRVRSPRWGSARWSTPLSELVPARASTAEAQAYARFRERYEREWRDVFDPIALRLSRSGASWEADLTVRPLIAQTEYRWMRDLAGDARLVRGSAGAHAGTLAHLALAVDFDAGELASLLDVLRGATSDPTVELLGWMAGGVGVYVEPDQELFADWAKRQALDEADLWLEEHWMELPVALHVDSRDPMLLALFVSALRAFAEGTAPRLVRWETREVRERSFVTIHAVGMRGMTDERELCLHYATLPGAWILSFREDVLLAAIERDESARDTAEEPWLGESAALHIDRGLLEIARALGAEEAQRRARAMAYGPIALLDDWRRRFAGSDPAELYHRLFGVRLVDPTGAAYVWDEEWETHASPAFGHPAQPREGPAWPSLFDGLEAIDLGVTFEADGLRARARLVRE